ncbi:MAG: bactofilin family protein [Myxococcota bacterium]
MADTIIGSNITIEGEISGNDPLIIEGIVRGTVNVKSTVTVTQDGHVEANVDSQSIEIAGTVEGNVTAADKIDIKAGGRLVGDVKAPRVLIADGAAFKGNINMQG